MPRFSVITPLHAPGNRYIIEAYQSLCSQTFSDWEWLILENHGGEVPDRIRDDPRVRVSKLELDGIGALKQHLCSLVESPWVVEFDNDDILVPIALEKIAEAFERGADFIYSDFAEFKDPGWHATWDRYPYGTAYGWTTYPITYDGHDLVAMHAPPVNPHNIRLVEWAPNHVRAWTKAAYEEVGGHNPAMKVADDHDLIVRFYLAKKKFEHIPKCLYLYRVHDANTVELRNQAIREGTQQVYNRSIWPLADRWTEDRKLLKVDLCGGIGTPIGYLALDKRIPSGINGIECDLNKKWPVKDNSVGILRAHDAIEHLADHIHTMEEAHRILAPGGFFMIHVPSTNGQGAFCDPTHKSFWNKLSFRYYTDKRFATYIPECSARFQISRIIEWFPSEDHRINNIPYVEAHLFAIKDGFRPMGENLWEGRIL
jgi:O-antigen biosynthesis protein